MWKYSFDLICRHPAAEEANSQMLFWCNRFFCHQLKCARPCAEKRFCTIRGNAFNTMGSNTSWWGSKCWKQIYPIVWIVTERHRRDSILEERDESGHKKKMENAFTIYLSAAIPLLSHSHCVEMRTTRSVRQRRINFYLPFSCSIIISIFIAPVDMRPL